MAWVPSLAPEFPHPEGTAKRERERESVSVCVCVCVCVCARVHMHVRVRVCVQSLKECESPNILNTIVGRQVSEKY